MHHHPWRAFRELTDWTLIWAQLPLGIWGLTDFKAKTVTLTLGMSQAERRCTIEHERHHILRGPATHGSRREEVEVDRNAVRLLLPSVRAIADALVWARGDIDAAADELWVDGPTLQSRLKYLHPSERAWLRQRLEDAHE